MTTVLIIQLVVPLVLGIPALIVSEWLPYRRSKSDSSVGGSAYGATQLKPLQCPHCSAPVPLQRQPAPCPSCGETVTPPPEYVHMLDSRAQAIAELARAERWWRWSRWTSSPIVGIVLALASVAWLVVVVWAMIVTGWSMWANLVLGMTVAALSIGGVVTAYLLIDSSDSLPPLPPRAFRHPPAASATCKHCNAPIRFQDDELATLCPYCQGENYRELAGRVAETDAVYREQAAATSLVEAKRALDERRDWVLGTFGIAALVELLYGSFAVFGWVSDLVSHWLDS